MTDLLTVLPHFDSRPYTHVLPSLEKALITCSDLLTLDAIHVAKRAQLPPAEVKKLGDALLDALGDTALEGWPLGESGVPNDAGEKEASVAAKSGKSLQDQWIVSTLDDKLDIALNGGIHSGYLTEITGERYALSDDWAVMVFSTDDSIALLARPNFF
jgi:DNA repair protein RAD57